MVERTRLLGLLIIMVTTAVLVVPEGFSRQQFAIGLGISHRPSEVTAYPDRVNSFEVARIYNTGDEVITIQAVWKPITETTDISVDLFPPERTLQPDETYLLTATAATTEHLGTTHGVVEIITLSGVVAPDAFVGGVVVPGAELPFEISVVNPPAEATQPLDGRTLGALAGYIIGGALVLADPEKLVFSL